MTNGVCRAQKESVPTADQKIIECIKKGDVVCISEFLGRGGNPKAVDDKELPLLVIASEAKSATVVRLLINAGADPNKGSADLTPLCRAALFGRKDIAQTLLDAGAKADVLCDSDHGDSALMEAVRGAMFSDLPTDFKDTVFGSEEPGEGGDTEEDDADSAKLREVLSGSTEEYLEITRMLLAKGVDVNVVAKCDVGESALMYAAMAANVSLVKTLLTHGADVKKDPPILDFLRGLEMEYKRAKSTPLPVLSRQQAAMIDWNDKTRPEREEIVRLLTAAGAKESENDQEEDDYQPDPKEYAREAFSDVIERNDQKDFERLLAGYINDPLGAEVLPNALRLAVIYSRVDMVKLLLKSGVNPNIPSTTVNYTPLMQAASSANLELVKLLLDAGADLNAEDSSGQTALDAAAMYANSSEQNRTVVAFLKERGAKRGNKKK